jgi:hypothetical protein
VEKNQLSCHTLKNIGWPDWLWTAFFFSLFCLPKKQLRKKLLPITHFIKKHKKKKKKFEGEGEA